MCSILIFYFCLAIALFLAIFILFSPKKKYNTSTYYPMFYLFCGVKREYKGVTLAEKKEECKRLYKEDIKTLLCNHNRIITDTHELFVSYFLDVLSSMYRVPIYNWRPLFFNQKSFFYIFENDNRYTYVTIKKIGLRQNRLKMATLPVNADKEEIEWSQEKQMYYRVYIQTTLQKKHCLKRLSLFG